MVKVLATGGEGLKKRCVAVVQEDQFVPKRNVIMAGSSDKKNLHRFAEVTVICPGCLGFL